MNNLLETPIEYLKGVDSAPFSNGKEKGELQLPKFDSKHVEKHQGKYLCILRKEVW